MSHFYYRHKNNLKKKKSKRLPKIQKREKKTLEKKAKKKKYLKKIVVNCKFFLFFLMNVDWTEFPLLINVKKKCFWLNVISDVYNYKY